MRKTDDAKYWNCHTLLVGMLNCAATVEKFGNFLYKVKHTFTLCPSYPAPRYSPKRKDNRCPQKGLYMNVHTSFIHNSQKVEATQVLICRRMRKSRVILPHDAVLLSNQRIKLLIHAAAWTNLKSIMLTESSFKQKNTYFYNIIYIIQFYNTIYEVLEQAKLQYKNKAVVASDWMGRGIRELCWMLVKYVMTGVWVTQVYACAKIIK